MKDHMPTNIWLGTNQAKRWIILATTGVAIWACLEICISAYQHYVDKKFVQMQTNNIIKPVKVFQIGFSKCGTTTLAKFFSRNGVPTIHHNNGLLPYTIYYNYIHGLPLISSIYDGILVFTDMDLIYSKLQISVGMQYFKELDKQYPGSKFILNTRSKDAWLRSRSKQDIMPDKGSLLKLNAELLQISEEQVLAKWSAEWDSHHQTVKEYFKDRPYDLLVFDIEKDPPEKIIEFFKGYYNLERKFYKKMNQTSYKWLSKYLNLFKIDLYYSNGKWSGI